MRRILASLLILILSVCSLDAAAAFVQDDVKVTFSGTTNAAVFTNSVVSGNFVAGGVCWLSATVTLSSITKTAGTSTIGTPVLLHNPTTQAAQGRAAMYYIPITGSGTLTLTATFSGSVVASQIIHEVSGVNAVSPLVGSAMQAQTNPGTGTDAWTSGAFSVSAAADDYTFGHTCDPANNGAVVAAGTNYTARADDAQAVAWTESRVTAASTATFTGDLSFADPITGGMVLNGQSGAACSPTLLLIRVGAC